MRYHHRRDVDFWKHNIRRRQRTVTNPARTSARDEPAMTRGCGLVLGLLLVLGGATGCASHRPAGAAGASHALAHPETTRLGAQLAARAARHPGQSGIYVLDSNVEAFQARAQLVEAAEKTLDVQSYIIWGDRTGRLLATRILDAADRGVRVRILVDDVNVVWKDSWITRLDAHPHIELRVFNPFLGTRTFALLVLRDFVEAGRLSRRMHNKVFAADNAVAIMGGRNIGDEYFAARADLNFEDLDVLTVGPVVQELSASFDEYWNSPWAFPLDQWKSEKEKAKDMKKARQAVEPIGPARLRTPFEEALAQTNLLHRLLEEQLHFDWAKARVFYDLPEKVAGGNNGDGGTRVISEVWAMVRDVQHELILISPYFVPGEEGVALFRELRRRGVRIRILTNSLGSTDVALAQTGYARYRQALLHEGVEIYELKPSAMTRLKDRGWLRRHATRPQTSLHAKAFIFDRQTVFVGSMNLDYRALYLNTELGLLVESPALANKLSTLFEDSVLPQHSYRMGLQTPTMTASPKLQELHSVREWPVWITEEKGQVIRHAHEPHVGLWRRFITAVMMLLPLDSQL